MNTLIKQSKRLVLAFMFVTTATFAQQEVSDTELSNFAKAVVSLQEINMDAQRSMMEVVNGTEIDFERFNELYEAAMMDNGEVLSTMSVEENETFDYIMAHFEAMYIVFEKQMEEAIAKENITMERFETIAAMMESDFALQMRLQAMMEE